MHSACALQVKENRERRLRELEEARKIEIAQKELKAQARDILQQVFVCLYFLKIFYLRLHIVSRLEYNVIIIKCIKWDAGGEAEG